MVTDILYPTFFCLFQWGSLRRRTGKLSDTNECRTGVVVFVMEFGSLTDSDAS